VIIPTAARDIRYEFIQKTEQQSCQNYTREDYHGDEKGDKCSPTIHYNKSQHEIFVSKKLEGKCKISRNHEIHPPCRVETLLRAGKLEIV